MARTVVIRDLDDATYGSLSDEAACAGVSVSELLRRAAVCIAQVPSMTERLPKPGGRELHSPPADPVAVLDELRGGGSSVLVPELG